MARHKVEIANVNTQYIKVLTNEEMTELFVKYQNGEILAKEELINGNLKLVLSILRKYKKSDIEYRSKIINYSSLNFFIAKVLSGAEKTVFPATRTLAPAFLTTDAFSKLIPPSISSKISLPLASMILRILSTLGNTSAMNFWPPKPGKTLITKIISQLKISFSTASTGVSGLITKPHFTPQALISSKV